MPRKGLTYVTCTSGTANIVHLYPASFPSLLTGGQTDLPLKCTKAIKPACPGLQETSLIAETGISGTFKKTVFTILAKFVIVQTRTTSGGIAAL